MAVQTPTPETLRAAVAALRGGGLVAFPTETVYGLGADASNPNAVARIFAAKGRPANHPLIVHLYDGSDLATDAGWAGPVSDHARALADAFWPGPLTLIVPRGPQVPDAVTGGLDSVGLRVPAHPVARALLKAFGGGVAAPSANKFGDVSPTTAAHVDADFGDELAFVLDGGPCGVGVESTIVDATGPALSVLRAGGVSLEALSEVLGVPVGMASPTAAVRAPGTLPSHYAPKATVVLATRATVVEIVAEFVNAGERVGVLAPGDIAIEGAHSRPLWPDAAEAQGRRLYALLRAFDGEGCTVIVAVPPLEVGLGAAVADRLRRSAAPRNPSDHRPRS